MITLSTIAQCTFSNPLLAKNQGLVEEARIGRWTLTPESTPLLSTTAPMHCLFAGQPRGWQTVTNSAVCSELSDVV